MSKSPCRILSFYLPQFHPIPENDEWWGKGFTEWTNVASAKPLFRGHYQPHIPADLGFYDLRLAETRNAQAELAKQHGIEGFCYWHYWFNGRRLLERPFNEILSSHEPDFPICLAWANESWSRRWLGEEKAILMQQDYSREDNTNHCHWLAEAFSDPRYIKVNERALFLIYRPRHLPEPERFTHTLREICLHQGLAEPFLVGIDAHCPNFDCREIGFDTTLKFEPQLGLLPYSHKDDFDWKKSTHNILKGNFKPNLKVYDYVEARRLMNEMQPGHPYIPCVFVGWDNTPRRGKNGVIITNATPENFAIGLQDAMESVIEKPAEERFFFINAWNEWAEGNHLEPDQRYGTRFLEAVRELTG